jgi:hypothetical protein
MGSIISLQDASNPLPADVASNILRWKIEYGGLYLAPFRRKIFGPDDTYFIDYSAPWIVAILRELTLREYIAYCELADYDPKLASISLIRLVLLYAYDTDTECMESVDADLDVLDNLFGQYTTICGFFRGDTMAAQKTIRTGYGPVYHNFVILRLLTNMGMDIKNLLDLPDSRLMELFIAYSKTSGGKTRPQVYRTGNPALDRQLAKQALVDMSEQTAMSTLADRMARAKQGQREEINPAAENTQLLGQFGDAVLRGEQPPDVTKLKRYKKPPAPTFTTKPHK